MGGAPRHHKHALGHYAHHVSGAGPARVGTAWRSASGRATSLQIACGAVRWGTPSMETCHPQAGCSPAQSVQHLQRAGCRVFTWRAAGSAWSSAFGRCIKLSRNTTINQCRILDAWTRERKKVTKKKWNTSSFPVWSVASTAGQWKGNLFWAVSST